MWNFKRYIFVLVGILMLFSCTEKLQFEFSGYDRFIESDIYKNGWIDWDIPETASEIRIRNDLDTNKIWMRISFLTTAYNTRDFQSVKDESLYHSILKVINETPSDDDQMYLIENQVYLIVSQSQGRAVYYKQF